MIIRALLCFCITGCVRKVKPSALTRGSPPATWGNRFPPSDHRGRVILNLRLLLWHGGMSPLRLQDTHTHTHTFIHTWREISHAYQTGKYIPQRESRGERAPAAQLLPPSLMFEGNGMTACYQCEGIWLSGFKCAMIDSLMTDTHSLPLINHSLYLHTLQSLNSSRSQRCRPVCVLIMPGVVNLGRNGFLIPRQTLQFVWLFKHPSRPTCLLPLLFYLIQLYVSLTYISFSEVPHYGVTRAGLH